MLKFLLLLICTMLCRCGGVTLTETSAFKLRMLGTYEQPAGAEGSASPQSQTFLFKSLKITKESGEEVELYAASNKGTTYKIIDRPQLIYTNTDMSEYDGETFSKVVATFDSAIVVTTKNNKEINVTLDTGALELVETFKIATSKNQTLTIKAAWGKTITETDDGTESSSAPSFSMIYSND